MSSARTLTEEEARAAGLLDKPREIRFVEVPEYAKVTRRLALAALRLAVFGVGMSQAGKLVFATEPFARLAEWSGAIGRGDSVKDNCLRALDEAVAALREAGEVSE